MKLCASLPLSSFHIISHIISTNLIKIPKRRKMKKLNMVAITEERGKKGASRKEKREGKERRIVEGKLPRHRVVANGINFRDFSSLCGLHMAVNINRFSPGEFPSPGPRP